MKRRLIIVAIVMVLVGISGIVWKTGVFDTQKRRTSAPVGQTFTVVASDAPGWMRVDGPGRYLCDGTADNVEIQAAIDAANANVTLLSGVAYKGGAIVELSGGTFNMTKSATAGDEVSGTGDVSRAGGTAVTTNAPLNGTLTGGLASVLVVTYDSTWDIDDIAAGQMYDLREGDRGGGVSMDDDYERFVGMCGGVTTVPALTTITYTHATMKLAETGIGVGVSSGDFCYISGGTNAIAGWYEVDSVTNDNEIILTAQCGTGNQVDFVSDDAFSVYGGTHVSYTYDDVEFTRVPAAIYKKKNVHLMGAGGVNDTLLLLSNAQDCAVIQIEVDLLGGNVQRGFRISNLTINGNKANQTDAAKSHGIVTSYNAFEVQLDNVRVLGCLGDAAWINVCEFARITKSNFAGCDGYGLCLGPGGPGTVTDSAPYGNVGPGLVLHRTSSESVVVSGCNFRVIPSGGTDYAVVCIGSVAVNFNNNYFGPTDTAGGGEAGGIYISNDSTKGVISGNYFDNEAGTAITNDGYFWTISGNTIRRKAGSVPYVPNTGWHGYPNTVVGNAGIRVNDEQLVMRAQNDSGAAITNGYAVIRKGSVTATKVTVGSSRADKILGIAWTEANSAANAAWFSVVSGGLFRAIVDDNDDLSIGDPLCISGAINDEGQLTLADTAGDLVVAIVEEDGVPATPWNGTEISTLVTLLRPKDQYVIPGTQMSIVEGILGDAKAFWPCLEETGSTVTDLTSTHDLTSSEAVSAFDAVPSFTGSKLVYNLNGTDEEFDAADHGDFTFGDGTDDSPFSVGAWVYITDTAARRVIIAKTDEDTDVEIREWILEIDASDKLTIRLYDESANAYMGTVSNAAPSAAGWHFVVATYTGVAEAVTELNLYVDGALVASTDADDQGGTYVAMEDTATKPTIGFCLGTDGTPTPSYFFNGKLTMPFVTGTELSAPTIARLYTLTREFLNQ